MHKEPSPKILMAWRHFPSPAFRRFLRGTPALKHKTTIPIIFFGAILAVSAAGQNPSQSPSPTPQPDFLLGDYIHVVVWSLALAVLWTLAVVFRQAARKWLSTGGWKIGTAKGFAYFFAVATTATIGWFEPWKPVTWTTNEVGAVYGLLLAATWGTCGIFAEWARTCNDTTDRDELAKLRAAHEATEKQLDNWVRGSTQIGSVLGKKVKVFRELSRSKAITLKEFLAALASDQYVFHNVHAIYEFVQRKLPAGAKLRIALYHCQQNEMVPLYSWDGEKANCINPNPEAMRTNSSEGIHSTVVQCFHSTTGIVHVADCLADEQFQHFRPGQSEYLKSMIAFKHRLEMDGTATAMILALDCDQTGFFNKGRAEELRNFLIEMMKRVEYEALTSDITSKLVS
jgi:hypothetical protein